MDISAEMSDLLTGSLLNKHIIETSSFSGLILQMERSVKG